MERSRGLVKENKDAELKQDRDRDQPLLLEKGRRAADALLREGLVDE
jgi:hypothetical protein